MTTTSDNYCDSPVLQRRNRDVGDVKNASREGAEAHPLTSDQVLVLPWTGSGGHSQSRRELQRTGSIGQRLPDLGSSLVPSVVLFVAY